MRPELVAWYGRERLPRPASYPTVPHFSSSVGAGIYAEWLNAIPQHATASLYLHVPYCRSMCWHCSRHTSVVSSGEAIAVYEAALRCEIDLVSRQIGCRLEVDRIQFSGGTPTMMAPESFADLIGAIRHAFFVVPAAEVAVEIDPRSLTFPMIEALALGGVNRASLGVPSFDPVVQRAINRMQSFEETAVATRGLRRAGIAGIDLDLIYGLPYQTVASCLDTVRRSVELGPDRFSVSGYAHLPASREHQRRNDEAGLPDGSERFDQSSAIGNALTEAGYVQIGPGYFARSGDAMALRPGRLRRNFDGYATDAGDILLGFGASAIGQLPQGYVQNEVHTDAYSETVATGRLATARGHALTGDDRRRAETIAPIIFESGADPGPTGARHGSVPEQGASSPRRLYDMIFAGAVETDAAAPRQLDRRVV